MMDDTDVADDGNAVVGYDNTLHYHTMMDDDGGGGDDVDDDDYPAVIYFHFSSQLGFAGSTAGVALSSNRQTSCPVAIDQ